MRVSARVFLHRMQRPDGCKTRRRTGHDPISESILKGEYTDGDTIDVYMEDGEIKFKKAPKAEAITTEEISK